MKKLLLLLLLTPALAFGQSTGLPNNPPQLPSNLYTVQPAGTSSSANPNVGGPSMVLLSPNCPTSNANNCFNTPADTQVAFDTSVTSGQNTVTCPNSDCNFVSADTGKSCWMVGSTGGYTFGNSLGTFTYISAQSGTCATGTNALTTETATGRFAWGHNDGPNIRAATTALYALPHCGTLVLPAARMILDSGVGANPAAPSSCGGILASGYYAGEGAGFSVSGQGRMVSIIHPSPGFDFTKCIAGSCFWTFSGGQGGSNFNDFMIDGLTASLSGISTAPANTLWAMTGVTGGRISNIFAVGWAYSASNSPSGLTFQGQAVPNENVEVYNFGKQQGRNSCGSNNVMVAHYAGGGLDVPAGNFCIDVGSAYTTNVANIDGISVPSTAILQSFGTWSQESSANSDSIAVGGTVYCYGCGFGSEGSGLATTYQAIKMTGGSIYLSNSILSGGSTAGVISGSTGTVYNLGGNRVGLSNVGPFTFSGNYIDQTGTFNGAGCSGVATASQTLGLYGTGPNVTLTTCTSTTIGSGIRIPGSMHIYELIVTATAGGVNASSGVVTVRVNGSNTSMTCTIGTGTSCTDGAVAHFVTLAKGDLVSVQFTTQAAETLAGVQVSLIIW